MCTGCNPRPGYQDGALSLRASDGVALVGHYYAPLDDRPPGLVLVHRAGGNRQVWDLFAVRSQQSGYLTVSIDLRGHGESVADIKAHAQFSVDDWQTAGLDIDAAFRKLLELGANPDDLFVLGEGFGANLALAYTVEHRDVQGVVLLSPGAEYHGLEAAMLMKQMTTRPTLLLWCERDVYAASCASNLQAVAPGLLEVREYPGSAHGADIFTTSPSSVGQVLVWLDQMKAKSTPASGLGKHSGIR